MVHHTPTQKHIVMFCAEGVEPRLGEDEFSIIGSLKACAKVPLRMRHSSLFFGSSSPSPLLFYSSVL